VFFASFFLPLSPTSPSVSLFFRIWSSVCCAQDSGSMPAPSDTAFCLQSSLKPFDAPSILPDLCPRVHLVFRSLLACEGPLRRIARPAFFSLHGELIVTSSCPFLHYPTLFFTRPFYTPAHPLLTWSDIFVSLFSLVSSHFRARHMTRSSVGCDTGPFLWSPVLFFFFSPSISLRIFWSYRFPSIL